METLETTFSNVIDEVKAQLESESRGAKRWYYFWMLLSYGTQCLLGVLALVMALAKSVGMSDDSIENLAITIAFLTGLRTAGRFEDRKVIARMISDLFESSTTEIDRIYNLISNIFADGQVDESEKTTLSRVFSYITQIRDISRTWLISGSFQSPEKLNTLTESLTTSNKELERIVGLLRTQQRRILKVQVS